MKMNRVLVTLLCTGMIAACGGSEPGDPEPGESPTPASAFAVYDFEQPITVTSWGKKFEVARITDFGDGLVGIPIPESGMVQGIDVSVMSTSIKATSLADFESAVWPETIGQFTRRFDAEAKSPFENDEIYLNHLCELTVDGKKFAILDYMILTEEKTAPEQMYWPRTVLEEREGVWKRSHFKGGEIIGFSGIFGSIELDVFSFLLSGDKNLLVESRVLEENRKRISEFQTGLPNEEGEIDCQKLEKLVRSMTDGFHGEALRAETRAFTKEDTKLYPGPFGSEPEGIELSEAQIAKIHEDLTRETLKVREFVIKKIREGGENSGSSAVTNYTRIQSFSDADEMVKKWIAYKGPMTFPAAAEVATTYELDATDEIHCNARPEGGLVQITRLTRFGNDYRGAAIPEDGLFGDVDLSPLKTWWQPESREAYRAVHIGDTSLKDMDDDDFNDVIFNQWNNRAFTIDALVRYEFNGNSFAFVRGFQFEENQELIHAETYNLQLVEGKWKYAYWPDMPHQMLRYFLRTIRMDTFAFLISGDHSHVSNSGFDVDKVKRLFNVRNETLLRDGVLSINRLTDYLEQMSDGFRDHDLSGMAFIAPPDRASRDRMPIIVSDELSDKIKNDLDGVDPKILDMVFLRLRTRGFPQLASDINEHSERRIDGIYETVDTWKEFHENN